ncbi:MAG TPA: hypothetical protein VER33_21130 [Polyangiaceae bacterium]|nr:hypothetical protein [Polyangiaceae bacterium]
MQERSATLVVIEFGACWPRWLEPNGPGDMAVVAQHYAGPPSSLVVQVESRVGRLLTGGWRINQIVLVSNGQTDLEALSARSLLTRRLLGQLLLAGGGGLVLTVREELGRRACETLIGLCASLQQTALPRGVSLSVRVVEREPTVSKASPAGVPRSARADASAL